MNMENKYLLILFYSAGGSTRKIAHAIADGAEEENLNVKIRTVPKVSSLSEKTQDDIPEKGEVYCTKDDLINCSGLAIGSPTRFGSMASPLKYFLDSTGDLWASNSLENKPGMAFTSKPSSVSRAVISERSCPIMSERSSRMLDGSSVGVGSSVVVGSGLSEDVGELVG